MKFRNFNNFKAYFYELEKNAKITEKLWSESIDKISHPVHCPHTAVLPHTGLQDIEEEAVDVLQWEVIGVAPDEVAGEKRAEQSADRGMPMDVPESKRGALPRHFWVPACLPTHLITPAQTQNFTNSHAKDLQFFPGAFGHLPRHPCTQAPRHLWCWHFGPKSEKLCLGTQAPPGLTFR